MRKILAGFMATAMVTSICATMSFAASAKPTATKTPTAGVTTFTGTVSKAILTVNGVNYEEAIVDGHTYANATTSAANNAVNLDDTVFSNVEIDGRTCDIIVNANALGAITLTLDAPFALSATTAVSFDLVSENNQSVQVAGDKSYTFSAGSGNLTVDENGSSDLTSRDVFKCGPDGNPLAMTEKGVGVDKNQNDENGVQSSRTVYFMVKNDTGMRLEDDNFWKMRVNKADNGKYVKAISDVTKNFSTPLVNVLNGEAVSDTTNRHRFIKVELNEIYTDDEYKIGLDVTFTPKSAAIDNANIVLPGTSARVTDDVVLKISDFYFYMKNIVKAADNDWKVGIDGLMLNPITNDWNEVTYTDEDGDVAFMKFFGDSDTGKFYAKLSTKWAHEDYAAYFNDQDAYYFEFTGSPKLSSTSRADLQIYNPFVDDDGNETIDPTTATIYQVVDGDLIDITDSFTYGEGDNGDNAFITRTRFLGSYIICEKPVEEAAGDSDIDDLMPDDNETPTDVTPDNNGGGKAPANTGRYA